MLTPTTRTDSSYVMLEQLTRYDTNHLHLSGALIRHTIVSFQASFHLFMFRVGWKDCFWYRAAILREWTGHPLGAVVIGLLDSLAPRDRASFLGNKFLFFKENAEILYWQKTGQQIHETECSRLLIDLYIARMDFHNQWQQTDRKHSRRVSEWDSEWVR